MIIIIIANCYVSKHLKGQLVVGSPVRDVTFFWIKVGQVDPTVCDDPAMPCCDLVVINSHSHSEKR